MSLDSSLFIDSMIKQFDRLCEDIEEREKDISICLLALSAFAQSCKGPERENILHLAAQLDKFKRKALKTLSTKEKKEIHHIFQIHKGFHAEEDEGYSSKALQDEQDFETITRSEPRAFKESCRQLQGHLKELFKQPPEEGFLVKEAAVGLFKKVGFKLSRPVELMTGRIQQEQLLRKEATLEDLELNIPEAFFVDHISDKRGKEMLLKLASIYPTHIQSDGDISKFIEHIHELINHYYPGATQDQKKTIFDTILISSTQVLQSAFSGGVQTYLSQINQVQEVTILETDVECNFIPVKQKKKDSELGVEFSATLTVLPKIRLEGKTSDEFLELLQKFKISPALIVDIRGRVDFSIDPKGLCKESISMFQAKGFLPSI